MRGPELFDADAAGLDVVVRCPDGIFRQARATTGPRRPRDVDVCGRTHGKLREDKRCRGCGRTRNEIELDEG